MKNLFEDTNFQYTHVTQVLKDLYTHFTTNNYSVENYLYEFIKKINENKLMVKCMTYLFKKIAYCKMDKLIKDKDNTNKDTYGNAVSQGMSAVHDWKEGGVFFQHQGRYYFKIKD